MTTEGQKHTAGKLIAATAASSVVGLPIVSQSGRSVANVTSVPSGFPNAEAINAESLANARRLAACWNACAGIPTEELEAGREYEAQQRPDLGAARKDMCARLESFARHLEGLDSLSGEAMMIRDAIALLATPQAASAEQQDGCRTAFEKHHWPTMFQDREMMKRMRGKEPYRSSYREWRTAWQLALASLPNQQAPASAHLDRARVETKIDMAVRPFVESFEAEAREHEYYIGEIVQAALSAMPNLDDGGLVEEVIQALERLKMHEGNLGYAGRLTDYHEGINNGLQKAIEMLARHKAQHHPTFQSRVAAWMNACFGPAISADKVERNHRFLEEALELVQALGCSREDCLQLVNYVYDRPVGEPSQEVGGVMVTLAALCLASGLDMDGAAETELARVWTKIDVIRAKQAAKPRGSALPVSPSYETKPVGTV